MVIGAAADIFIRRAHQRRTSRARGEDEAASRGQSDDVACQTESSWSRNDQEDGGPTIQLPAAKALLHPSSPEFESSICERSQA
jgi:hypothetical protein